MAEPCPPACSCPEGTHARPLRIARLDENGEPVGGGHLVARVEFNPEPEQGEDVHLPNSLLGTPSPEGVRLPE